MCSISGSVSVPGGSAGFGREPGRRIDGVVVDVDRGSVLVARDEVEGADDFELLEEQAASAVPAARAPRPFRTERRLSAVGGSPTGSSS